MTTKDMPFHPLAECFPLVEGEPFDRLCEDIQAHGYRQQLGKILLFEDAILDGRNRYRALAKAGLPLNGCAEPFTGSYDEARDLVVASNLNRRHLTVKQRAVAASKLANCTRGGDQRAALHFGKDGEKAERTSLEAAAKQLGVSRRTVASVREYERLKAQGALKPAEIEAVEHGNTPHSTVNEKARARLKGAEQRAARTPTERDKIKLAVARRRFLTAIGQMESAITALATHDTPTLTKKERSYASHVFQRTAIAIRQVRKDFARG